MILKRFLNQTPYHKAPIFNLLFKGDRRLKEMRPGYFAALRFIKSNVFNNSLQCCVFTKLCETIQMYLMWSLSVTKLWDSGRGGSLLWSILHSAFRSSVTCLTRPVTPPPPQWETKNCHRFWEIHFSLSVHCSCKRPQSGPQFQHPQLTTASNSSSMGSNTLSCS